MIDSKHNELVQSAEYFARGAHGAINQRRKYNGEPYVNHCQEVAEILVRFASYPVTSEQIAAAWLHDTVEDTHVTLEQIRDCFGEKVAILVEALTDVSRPGDGNRRARKQKDLEHTATATIEAKSVKLADLISNSNSIVAHDPDFARIYLKEKARILEVCADADPGLWQEAFRVLQDGEKKLIQQHLKGTNDA